MTLELVVFFKVLCKCGFGFVGLIMMHVLMEVIGFVDIYFVGCYCCGIAC